MTMTERAGAVLVRANEGRAMNWGPAGTVRILAGADSTDGSFSICESIEPLGSGTPLHVHHGEAEAFYVLDGQIELSCGDDTVTARTGDFAYAPKGVPHKFVVVGDRPARVLMFFSRPGFESFFAEGGTPIDQPRSGSPNPDAMRRLLDKFDLEILEAPAH